MIIAILGTGGVGRTLAQRLATRHQVRLGTRDAGQVRDDLQTWLDANPAVTLHRFADAALGADLVLNATPGEVALDVLDAVGADTLDGAVILDLSNPLDFSRGFPPSLFVGQEDSLGERIQRRFPNARVVKSLNTLTADLMLNPAALTAPSTVFVGGDDADAKALVTSLLRESGHTDVIDLGGIESSRAAEHYLLLWIRLMGSLGTPTFNLSIVRQPS